MARHYKPVVPDTEFWKNLLPGQIDCGLRKNMVETVRHLAHMADPTKTVNVKLVWEPPWSPERMSDAVKRVLG
jgi:metal-sulfur cluster biosynthetic enzyme